MRPSALAHASWWCVAVALQWSWWHRAGIEGAWGSDLDVYLFGGRSVVQSTQLYGVPVHGLLFTYAPFAAVASVPLSLLPRSVAQALFTLATVAAYGVVMGVVGRRVRLGVPAVVSISLLGLCLEPVRQGLLLGQVNPLLAALVIVDLLVLPRGRSGVLVGLAAGVKLVPGVFVLWFLLRRDWRGLGLSAGAFLATVLTGAVAAPAGSRWYWLEAGLTGLDKFDRWHVLAPDNQSLGAFVDRLLHAGSLPSVVSVGCCALAVAAGALVARRALRHGDEVGALLALAFAGLLASPISWTHHWVWVAPALLVLAARRRWLLLGCVATLVVVGPMWLLPLEPWAPLRYSSLEVVVSATYTVVGVVLLAVLGRRRACEGATVDGALPGGGERRPRPSMRHADAGGDGSAKQAGPSLGRLRQGLRRRATGRRRDSGVAAVEAAIVLPMILLVFVAILEFGLVFKDWLGIVSATRAGARTASALSTNGGSTDNAFAVSAALQMAVTSTAIDQSTVTAVWVYQADANGNPDGGSSFTSCTVCDKFAWNGSTFAPVPGQQNFASGSLVTCANKPMSRTRIGVYMRAQHKALTGFIFQSLTLSEHVVMIAEPQPGSPPC